MMIHPARFDNRPDTVMASVTSGIVKGRLRGMTQSVKRPHTRKNLAKRVIAFEVQMKIMVGFDKRY